MFTAWLQLCSLRLGCPYREGLGLAPLYEVSPVSPTSLAMGQVSLSPC